MEQFIPDAEPRNEREASHVFGGGSTDLELSQAFTLGNMGNGDEDLRGHKENFQMSGEQTDTIAEGPERLLDDTLVIPTKEVTVPRTVSAAFNLQPDTIEKISLDFGNTNTALQNEDRLFGTAANADHLNLDNAA